jgi:hypothetical protein
MSSVTVPSAGISPQEGNKAKKKISWKNLGIGAAIQVFEVSTLGQPFEVLKTHMAGSEG